eukprot:m.30951 g.30951  ORF g.30951 m.30951 type:complete len:55 (-) comp14663_c0_seq2:31-195(-)
MTFVQAVVITFDENKQWNSAANNPQSDKEKPNVPCSHFKRTNEQFRVYKPTRTL